MLESRVGHHDDNPMPSQQTPTRPSRSHTRVHLNKRTRPGSRLVSSGLVSNCPYIHTMRPPSPSIPENDFFSPHLIKTSVSTDTTSSSHDRIHSPSARARPPGPCRNVRWNLPPTLHRSQRLRIIAATSKLNKLTTLCSHVANTLFLISILRYPR